MLWSRIFAEIEKWQTEAWTICHKYYKFSIDISVVYKEINVSGSYSLWSFFFVVPRKEMITRKSAIQFRGFSFSSIFLFILGLSQFWCHNVFYELCFFSPFSSIEASITATGNIQNLVQSVASLTFTCSNVS